MIRSLACGLAAFALAGASAQGATLVYTNDVFGEIEPCGCREEPLGGMARKQGLLRSLSDKDVLQLDAGNLLFASEKVPPALAAQAKLQAGFLVRAHNLLGQTAAVPGPNEFALGFRVFNELRGQAKFPFLAANLRRKDGKKFLEPYRVFRVGKLRVAVLGLVSPALAWPPEVQVTSALEAAENLVPRLRKKSDLVIALTHQGLERDTELAQSVAGLDLIVGGHTMDFLLEPKRVEAEGRSTYLFQSSYKNQYVGVVPLEKPFRARDHKLVALDPSHEDEGTIARLVAEFKTSVRQLSDRESREAAAATEATAFSKFHTFPKCAGCHMKQFDFWRLTPHFQALGALVEKDQAHNQECIRCHSVGFRDPHGFRHPKRMALLEDGKWAGPAELASLLKAFRSAKSLDDPVRLTEKGAELPLRTQVSAVQRAFAPVQCENCHQPGAQHPFSGTYTKTVGRDRCLQCHTRERAPAWYSRGGAPEWDKITQKRALITCPAGD